MAGLSLKVPYPNQRTTINIPLPVKDKFLKLIYISASDEKTFMEEELRQDLLSYSTNLKQNDANS